MRTGNHPLAQVVQDIIKDERFHASYTLKAVHDLNGEGEAQQILRNVRRAERHHYRQALRRMLERFEALGARPTSPLGALRWAILHASTATNLAFPVLPSYKRLPRTLTQLG